MTSIGYTITLNQLIEDAFSNGLGHYSYWNNKKQCDQEKNKLLDWFFVNHFTQQDRNLRLL